MKKFVGLALLGLVAFNSCDSGLNANEKSEEVSRKTVIEKGNGKYYTVLFRNGVKVTGFSDFILDEGDKYGVRMYFTSDFKKWIKQLDAAGIAYTSEPSSNPFKDQYIWFAKAIVENVYPAIYD